MIIASLAAATALSLRCTAAHACVGISTPCCRACYCSHALKLSTCLSADLAISDLTQDLLKACGRSHGLQDVHEALAAIKAAKVPCWSLDLISGLPHLTADIWEDTLQQSAALKPDHISVYDLQVCA